MMNEIPQDFIDAVAAEQAAMRETGLGAPDESTSRGLVNDIRMWLSKKAGGNWTPEDQIAQAGRGATGSFGGAYGQTPAPPGFGSHPDVLAALQDLMKKVNGRGGVDLRGIDEASKADEARLQGLLDKLNSVRAELGAYDANKPLTKVFDAASEYDRLKKATPDVRPDNSGYWMWQAADTFDRNKGWVPSQSKDAAARLMFDIDRKAGDDRRAEIDKILGFSREKNAGENLNMQEDFARNRAPLSSQMPGELDLNIMKAMQKMPAELLKAQLKAQAGAGKETALSQMADAMAIGVKKGLLDNNMQPTSEAGKRYLEMVGLGKKDDYKFNKDQAEYYTTALESRMGKAPDNAKRQIKAAFEDVMSRGGTPEQAFAAAVKLMQAK